MPVDIFDGGALRQSGDGFLWSKGIHLPGPPVLSTQLPLIIKELSVEGIPSEAA